MVWELREERKRNISFQVFELVEKKLGFEKNGLKKGLFFFNIFLDVNS